MIGRLAGTLIDKSAGGVVLDVGGVGYEVSCPLTVLDVLPRTNSAAVLWIHTHVREDQITLFGFTDAEQRRLFRQLIGVSGIGPKLALACLSGMDAEGLSSAIANGDVRKLSSIPGIGKRTAERLVLELKDKVGVLPGRPAQQSNHVADLQSALLNLGYKTREIDKLITGLGEEAHSMEFEALLREALRRLRR